MNVGKPTRGKTAPAHQPPPGFVSWRDFDPSLLPDDERPGLAIELTTYRDNLDDLLQHQGQYVVIKGKAILGHYRDRHTALAAAFKAYGAVPALVKKIVEFEPVRHFGQIV